MIGYSFLLTLALVLGTPWWLLQLTFRRRYREGLLQRFGAVPVALAEAVIGRKVIWLHAVSVGEVLAAERLVGALGAALPGWLIVISTTTAAGQAIARKRFPADHVFYLPLDFAFAVRRYLRVLRPKLVILVESELWPRMLVECERRGTLVVVVNARISDRSYPRYLHLRRLWRPLLAKVTLFLAQGEESAERLRQIGAPPGRVRVAGNLKFDLYQVPESDTVQQLALLLQGRPTLLAGSTLPGEENMLLDLWPRLLERHPDAVLVIAPRHPQRFREVQDLLRSKRFPSVAASAGPAQALPSGTIYLLDTLGDLAAAYRLASVAFVGGSLVPKGGHNPLEAARFGVPVIMGASYENFREIVSAMREADAIRIVADAEELFQAASTLLLDDQGMGKRGRVFFDSQAGAVDRTVKILTSLIAERSR